MNRDDIDPGSAQGLEDRLKLRFEHREITIHHGLTVRSGEGARPRRAANS